MLMLTEQTPSTLGSFTLPTLASTGSVFCFSLGKLEGRNRQTVCNCSSKPFLLRGSWWDYIGIGVAAVLESSSALACFIACSKLSQPQPSVLQGVGFGKLTFSLFAWNGKSMRSYFCLFPSFTDIRKYRLRQANNLPKGWKWSTCRSRYELVLASFPGKDKEIPFPLLPVCLQSVHQLAPPSSWWSEAHRGARWLQPDEVATASTVSTVWPCKPGLTVLRRTPAAWEQEQLEATSLFCFRLRCSAWIPAGRAGDGNEYTFWSCRAA